MTWVVGVLNNFLGLLFPPPGIEVLDGRELGPSDVLDLFKQVFRPFATRLNIELRCILFSLIILEMFLQLDWSPPVVN
jgi:hypothetical protein